MKKGQHADQAVADLAACQHALVTRTQLLAAGLSPDAVRWRVRSRQLEPVQRGAYQVGPLAAPRAREMAAVLACGAGAVISHRSAAVLWQLCMDGDRARTVDVTVTRGDRGRRSGIRVHRVRLRPQDVTTLDGIPVTALARTIFDLASEAGSRELRQAFALGSRQRDTIHAELRELIGRHRKRHGIPLLRALLDSEIPPAATRSEAEERFLDLVRTAQLPRPEVNARIERREVDFLWRPQRIVVEVDGFAFHSSRTRFERDRLRDAVLAARGYMWCA
jgi:predicted transcriptional regulator of viral defense system